MKSLIYKLMVLILIAVLSGCGSLPELSSVRHVKVIDRLEARKLIPDGQNLPPNIRQSNSISVIELDYQKKSLESFTDEGGTLKVELLRCSNKKPLAETWIYADKVSVHTSVDVLIPAESTYFFVDSSMIENGCFRIIYRDVFWPARSAVYRLPSSRSLDKLSESK